MTLHHNHKIFIALGSNLGDRFENLCDAVDLIEQQLGLIIKVAPVYEVPAMGFDGNDFLNSCILVHAIKTPAEALEILQGIEKSMGRLPKTGESYENRVIDLDILLYDDVIMDDPQLTVPHPHMLDRDFVLKPLSAIASDVEHPVLKKTIGSLAFSKELEHLVEESGISLSRKQILDNLISKNKSSLDNDHLALNRFPIDQLNFIAIEGNIGSGKTSLAHKISEDFKGKCVLERFADNPFLPLFYEDKERYSFPLEMSFLADRYQQLSDDVAQHELFSNFTVADYYVIKSLIFSKITLHSEEYALYKRLFNMMYKELVKPDLYVYLYQTEERLLENIKKRGRDYEQNIEASYLAQIQQGYSDFIRSQKDLKIKVIDVTDLDFVNNQADYIKVLEQISEAIVAN
ncbi:2-amino-4-hydroxy-6-hydroxymethyldihydropteridine diphosphokinase [Nonlabens agnitus]|uniref:2-amino-4-hydroxy-6-hydroxymethyldihydropteridine pyrophosphokinase n=1 Tax=Nonlabens agnitus TaxID=870484 RepID=A0A2S9WVU3_9FLAO|nr:2-amino-4-hydroxy-6-hydroxymethyldihydropteridine diphosphokinase [Nonlabens agnitus]